MAGRPLDVARRALAAITEPALQCIYPPACHVCRTLGEPLFCDTCRDAVTLLDEPRCRRCLDSLPPHPIAGCCDRCSEGADHHIDAMLAVGAHEGPLQEAIHRLKYDGKRGLGGALGGMLADRLQASNLARPEILVPVPLHWTRRNMRGFNQSELIADAIAASVGIEALPRAMKRTRRTRPQARLDHHARAANVQGAFQVSQPSRIAGRHVGLVDDVVTTLHTSAECARVLSEAGAARVTVLCVARA